MTFLVSSSSFSGIARLNDSEGSLGLVVSLAVEKKGKAKVLLLATKGFDLRRESAFVSVDQSAELNDATLLAAGTKPCKQGNSKATQPRYQSRRFMVVVVQL